MFRSAAVKRFLTSSDKGVKALQAFAHFLIPLMIYKLSLGQIFLGIIVGILIFNIGHNWGAHRYITHKQFSAGAFGNVFLNFIFTLNVWGSGAGYAAVHIYHHEKSDQEDDPHSPNNSTLLRAWLFRDFGQKVVKFSVKTYQRVMKDPVVSFFHNYYFGILLIWMLFIFMLFGLGPFLVLCILPTVVCYHMGQALVILTHLKTNNESRHKKTHDYSKNIYFLKPIFWGDELHHNHHLRPSAVNLNFDNSLKESDLNFLMISLFFGKKTLQTEAGAK